VLNSKESSPLDDEHEDSDYINDQPSSTSRVPTHLEIRKKNIEENKRLLQLVNDEVYSKPRPKTLAEIMDLDIIHRKVEKILGNFDG
jgi:hypothetical protein